MFNASYRIVGNHFDAEDIMQEAFLAAFMKLNSFSEKVTFGAWLKRIVINKSINYLHKNKKIEWVPLEKIVEPSSESEIHYDSADAKQILAKVNKLPTNYRVAFTLYFLEGYDYEEISQILSISYQNSRVIVSRAKKKFQKLHSSLTL